MKQKQYRKPVCTSVENIQGIIPLAAVGAAASVAGLSVGGAALIGAASGLGITGDRDYRPVNDTLLEVDTF